MTKQEIKALVAAKIAGQGSQVDVGGALPSVLDAICDLIPGSGDYVTPLTISDSEVSESEGIVISDDRYYDIALSALLKWESDIYVKCVPDDDLITHIVDNAESIGITVSSVQEVYMGKYSFLATSRLEMAQFLACVSDGSGDRYLAYIDI